MFNKIIGFFSLILGAVLILGTFVSKNVQLVPFAVLSLITGIFLVAFDTVYEKKYTDGFKSRKIQRIFIITLTALWIIQMTILLIGLLSLSLVGAFPSMIAYSIAVLFLMLFFIPGLVIIRMFDKYSNPYKLCRKYFLTNEETINLYLADEKAFHSYSEDNFVLASDKALFFPKLFCLIPFNQITSVVSKKTMNGSMVYFNLTNGKKLKLITKHYTYIAKAIKDAK